MKSTVYMAALVAALGLALAGCGGGSSPGSTAARQTCSGDSAPHHAYLVVTHSDGASVQRCVAFSGKDIGGTALMKDSGLEYQTQTYSFGPAVCQIDHQPRTFSQCLPQSGLSWSLYVRSGGHWQQAQTGYAGTRVGNGGAMGWVYESSSSKRTPARPQT